MPIHKMKASTFEEADFGQWKEIAIQSLKGKAFESLMTKTAEGIEIQPLYTRADFEHRPHQIRVVNQATGSVIAQRTYAEDGTQFVVELKKSLDRGNGAIVYDGTKTLSWDEISLVEIAKLMTKYPVFISNTKDNDPFLKAFDLIPEASRASVKGAVKVQNWLVPEGFSGLRPLVADAWQAHHDGADAVTELALVLSQAADFASAEEKFTDFAEKFAVRFAVDTHFFMEIAKFRAFRVLWQAFCSAYGVSEAAYIPVHATTSLRSFSKLDHNVNLLRAGNATFSAVLGGADSITVHPYDILTQPTDSSVRFARNIQLVIKEETNVDKVLDPAGGSYFIETLTSELVDRAWALFLEIQETGGYEAFIGSGKLEAQLEALRVDVARGKKSLIGTNVYAELTATEFADSDILQPVNRLAEPYEELRMRFENKQPRTVLLTFGALKDFKPRADFVGGFLATGGLRSEWSPAFDNVQAALAWLASEKPDYAVVCASPALSESVLDELVQALPENTLVDAAGNYDQTLADKWQAAGLNGFVFAGQNKVEKLLDIESKLKGGANVE